MNCDLDAEPSPHANAAQASPSATGPSTNFLMDSMRQASGFRLQALGSG
jgi:hypothetical protein